MTLPIEILVHISGPSRGPDDARYRTEAQGLLDFEPARWHSVLAHRVGECSTHQGICPCTAVHESNNNAPLQRPAQIVNDISSSLWERLDNTTPYGATAPIAITSHLNLPAKPVPIFTKAETLVPGTSTRPTPKLLIERTPVLPRRHTAPAATPPTEGPNAACRTQSGCWETPPSVIPDSQPMHQISSPPSLKRPFEPTSSPSSTRNSDLPTEKRQRVGVNGTAARSSRRASSGGASLNPASEETTQGTPDSSASKALPSEIRPPRPQTSKNRFTSHLTPSLRTLSGQLPLAKYFQPLSQIRPTEKLERGHWFIPFGSWDETLKAEFWQFLSDFVGKGRAGWGVSCLRELQCVPQSSRSSKENRDPKTIQEVVKVYCWGEVVGEIWLALFLASARKVKGLGARWIDAAGESIIHMN